MPLLTVPSLTYYLTASPRTLVSGSNQLLSMTSLTGVSLAPNSMTFSAMDEGNRLPCRPTYSLVAVSSQVLRPGRQARVRRTQGSKDLPHIPATNHYPPPLYLASRSPSPGPSLQLLQLHIYPRPPQRMHPPHCDRAELLLAADKGGLTDVSHNGRGTTPISSQASIRCAPSGCPDKLL